MTPGWPCHWLCLPASKNFPSRKWKSPATNGSSNTRGQILPLIRLDRVLEERRLRVRIAQGMAEANAGPLQVLVCNDDGHTMGRWSLNVFLTSSKTGRM